jgi:uncharacterized membrane protein YfcA
MGDLLLVALAGFLASLVDGALGMGFGPTSSSILLASGLSPAAASATVNLAKVATGIAAAVSHWRFRNIDRGLVLRLAIPGALGALVGTTILANVDGDTIRPYLALLLMLVGLRILFRFSLPLPKRTNADGTPLADHEFDRRGVEVVGAAGGVTNGLIGAWGPVVTPFLLHRRLAPRLAVGSVNTAEVAVATVAAGSLLGTFSSGELKVGVVVAMLLGGVIAAPLSAWVVKYLPPRAMGLAVAALLLVTQTRELASNGDYPGNRWIAYAVVIVLVAAAVLRPRFRLLIAGDVASTQSAAPAD